MTRNQAITTYINSQVHANEMIRRLMLYNAKLTILENAKIMKIGTEKVRGMMRSFKLGRKQ